MAGQSGGACNGELFQIQSKYVDKTIIKYNQYIGLKYESNYWLSRYKGSVRDGYGMNMPCPGSSFTSSDINGCTEETWVIRNVDWTKKGGIVRHGDLVDIWGIANCFIFKKM